MIFTELRLPLNWRKENTYLLLIISIGAILRFYKLGAQSFWVDEIYSIIYARHLFDYIIHPPPFATHPPLSYVILWIFIEAFGTNEFIARLPSCLFGIATIPLVYFFGKQLFSEKEGLVASFIIALSPWYIQWSQEARMYTQLTVFTLLALYFLYQAIHKEKITFYVLSCIFMTLAFYSHYSGIFVLGIIVFWLISKRFFENRTSSINYKHLMIFFGLSFFLFLPLFLIAIPQAINIKFGGDEVRWGAPTVGYFIFNLFRNELGPILSLFSILGAVLIVLKRNNAGSLIIWYAAIPFLSFSLLALIMNVSLHYVVFTLPAFALLSSYLLIEVFKKLKKSEIDKEIRIKLLKNIQINEILAIGFLIGLLFGIHNLTNLYYYYSYGVHPDWRSACLFVKSKMNQEDMVVSTVIITVEYYLGRVDYKLDEENFNEIKNSQRRVWLLIDDWRIGKIDLDHEFRDWLISDCKMVNQVHLIKIYVFNPL